MEKKAACIAREKKCISGRHHPAWSLVKFRMEEYWKCIERIKVKDIKTDEMNMILFIYGTHTHWVYPLSFAYMIRRDSLQSFQHMFYTVRKVILLLLDVSSLAIG